MSLKKFAVLVCACILQLSPFPASAFDFTPFRARNLSPTVLVQSLATAEPARLVAPGDIKTSVDFDLASHAILSSGSDEQIRLDGETLVSTLGLRYGLGHRLQVGFDLPWINHQKGSLDDFISSWHDFFGLPNGDRDKLPDDALHFGYQRDGEELLKLDRPVNGLGDLRLQLAWQLAVSEPMATALHFSLKVPTGDADKLTGNEGWGASLALSLDRRFSLEDGATAAVWGGLGGSWLGDGKVLEAQARTGAANAWFGAGWSPMEWIAFKLQLDARTALYNSQLTELGSPAVMITMGGTLALGEQTSLDLGVGEDIAVNTAPDVTFHLGLSHTF